MRHMADPVPWIAGEIQTKLKHRALAARLRAAGLRAEVGESCHYESGRYVRVPFGVDDRFTLERIAPGEYLLDSDAVSMGLLYEAASRLSAALADLDIRHRFEIDDGGPVMLHYLHHRWPQEA